MIRRRDLLKAGLAGGVLLGGRGMVRGGQAGAKGVLAVCSGKQAAAMLERVLEPLGSLESFVTPGSLVVVKPNASFANPPEWGNNTSPELVAALCRQVLDAGARRVLVVDYPLRGGAEALEQNGIAAACRGVAGVQLEVLGERRQFVKVPVPAGEVLKEVEIARAVLDADLVINLPVAKAHDAVAASIGLKNLMGVIWDRTAFHTMLEINQAIADLARVVRPQLTIVDMTRVMVTNGPQGPGEVEQPNLLVACRDPVAADAYCLGRVRFNRRRLRPHQVRYLRLAHQAGLGQIDPRRLEIKQQTA
ncbi:MAG: hypothetical protein DRI34_06670 [Deltaproteobacteria bacterium]|nr:MAG: hypothetical protein DRI34_06670 [Deltaproteobacteria bacterium]